MRDNTLLRAEKEIIDYEIIPPPFGWKINVKEFIQLYDFQSGHPTHPKDAFLQWRRANKYDVDAINNLIRGRKHD